MNDQEYLFRHLAGIFHTGVFYLCENQLISYEENPEYNPLYNNEVLRLKIADSSDSQREPLIVRDNFHMFYICVKGMPEAETAAASHPEKSVPLEEQLPFRSYYIMGPLCTRVMTRTERHRFYRFYGIAEEWEKGLHYHTLMEILQITGVFAKMITGEEYTDQQLVDANYHAVTGEKEHQEQIRFDIISENEDIYRHTYQEERQIMDAVRLGDPDEAVRLSKEMDASVGRLGESEIEHWRNLAIVAATLCARAAIEGGVLPSVAYRLSGFYINKSTACRDITQILIYRNHAVEELAKRVREQKEKVHTSSYTEQCRDYIYGHYREKIYLGDMAETIGISEGYLSRLFKKETGISIQDFISDVRVEKAANLLRYSEESLSKIAEYVNFPTQSYFGKIFKKKMQMTPKQYRELYKPAEFQGLS
ncbi:MAG: AraC family transcriptional regulator [Clostridiales bacterium]|nr:AraC family transcriptional regulator [Clostridiales bacterium]